MGYVSRKGSGALTAIDLFAGAGGFTLAAKRAGIEVRAAVEIDPHACSTYKKNLVDTNSGFPKLIEGDINELSWDDLLTRAELKKQECSILLGGPPCQGFSTREFNPNLKDKAGREGIIDNKAAKAFRDVVQNILTTTARQFFGSASQVRADLLPDIKAAREQEKAKQAEKQVKARKRREFRQNLENSLAPLKTVADELESLAGKARAESLPQEESALIALRERVTELKQARAEYSLGSCRSPQSDWKQQKKERLLRMQT